MGFAKLDTYQNDVSHEVKKLVVNEKREKKSMDAESIENLVSGLENFGGIFDADQLDRVKILDLPVSLIINNDGHWLSIYIDQKSFEIMDSLGLTACKNIDKKLCRFICAHSYGKHFIATPKIQSDTSKSCGKFATSFLYFRTITSKNLKTFSTIFSQDFAENEKILDEIFQTIQKIHLKFSK